MKVIYDDEGKLFLPQNVQMVYDFYFIPFFDDGGGYCRCYTNNGMELTLLSDGFKCSNRNESLISFSADGNLVSGPVHGPVRGPVRGPP